MSNNKERFARFGIATKGFVYCLIGGLTAAAAFGAGGQKTGSSGVMEFLSNQSFGMFLTGITVLGLCGLVFWKWYQAFMDPEGKGTKPKAIATRIGYFSSGVFYGFLIVSGMKILLDSGSGSGGSSKESMISKLLAEPFGQILVGIVALVFLGKSIYQFWRAYSGKFKEKVQATGLKTTTRKFVLNAGRVGYTARGVVIAIVSFLTFRAAIYSNSDKAGGKEDAFQFVQNEFGTIVLITIALGLVAYGFFMFVKAKYRKMVI